MLVAEKGVGIEEEKLIDEREIKDKKMDK